MLSFCKLDMYFNIILSISLDYLLHIHISWLFWGFMSLDYVAYSWVLIIYCIFISLDYLLDIHEFWLCCIFSYSWALIIYLHIHESWLSIAYSWVLIMLHIHESWLSIAYSWVLMHIHESWLSIAYSWVLSCSAFMTWLSWFVEKQKDKLFYRFFCSWCFVFTNVHPSGNWPTKNELTGPLLDISEQYALYELIIW